MRPARRRHRPRGTTAASRLIDGSLVAIALVAGLLSAHPLLEDLRSSVHTEREISTLSAIVDETNDEDRVALLRQAQAYNARLGGDDSRKGNDGLHGCNGGVGDIIDTDVLADGELAPYQRQLSQDGRDAMGWIEVPSVGIRQPLRHGTSDETLAAGAGHLEWSSLPVGGVPSHCIIAGHSGMTTTRMFDDLDQVEVGDTIVLHVLGDAYQYEVFDIEVVEPDEVQDRCAIRPGEDLCTLMTCTPYGINSHRLLVHARRCPYEPSDEPKARIMVSRRPSRRVAPLLLLAGTLGLAGVVRLVRAFVRARRRRIARGAAQAVGAATRRRGTRALRITSGLLVGLVLVAMGGSVLVRQGQERHALAQLASDVTEPRTSTPDGTASHGGIRWDALRSANEDVDAWVRVEGTDIDLPVVAPSDGDMAFYLTHDLWRKPAMGGVPFLDHRCDANGAHRMAFGHHLATGGQFSSLQHASDQTRFDALGDCIWQTPEHGASRLVPFCAFEADMWFEPIQTFAFADPGSLRAWLTAIGDDASARAGAWRELAAEARSAVTLVTCSSDLPRQRSRTFVVFVEA